jgi:hypothetical protein
MVWPITGANLTWPKRNKSMKAGLRRLKEIARITSTTTPASQLVS